MFEGSATGGQEGLGIKGMLRTDPASTTKAIGNASPARSAPDRAPAATTKQPGFSRRKFGPKVAGSLAATVLIGSSSTHGFRHMADWVRRQSLFEIKPENITLQPEPPDWLLDGSDRLLKLVPEILTPERQSAGVLTTDPDEIARRLIMLMPWVETVHSVKLLHPNRLELHLGFRRPVMALSLIKKGLFLLDRQGVILPAADVRKDFLDNLIQFNYADMLVDQVVQRGGKHPAQLTPGQVWEDARVAESLALATFLTDQDNARKRLRRLFRLIDAANVQDKLIARTSDDLWIAWGRPPGQEQPGEPKAETKWRLLMEWLQLHGQSNAIDVNGSMLIFERDRAVLSRSGG